MFSVKRTKILARSGFALTLWMGIVACEADIAKNVAAEPKAPELDNSAFIEYVPAGWILQNQRILDIDLDKDGAKDAILTVIEDAQLQKGDRPEADDERAVLVLLGDKTGKYRLSSFAKNAILCGSCAGMMGRFGSQEQGTITYDGNVLSVTWMSGSRDSVDVDLTFGFDAKLKQFVLLSDSVDKRDRVVGKSTTITRDFVSGIKTVNGQVSKIDKKLVPLEAVKYYDYLNRNSF